LLSSKLKTRTVIQMTSEDNKQKDSIDSTDNKQEEKMQDTGVSGFGGTGFNDDPKDYEELPVDQIKKGLEESGSNFYKENKTKKHQANKYSEMLKKYYNKNGTRRGEGIAVLALILAAMAMVFWVMSVGTVIIIIMGLTGVILTSLAKYNGYQSGIRTAALVLSIIDMICGIFSLFSRLFLTF
jgi:hypothetical protein